MRAYFIQHVPFEGPGCLPQLVEELGFRLEGVPVHGGARLPSVADFDLLVLLGGPMSVNDEAAHPWLVPEKDLVREAVLAGKRVVGICLGAQMIASALGSRVYRNAEKEVGWFPVRASATPPGGRAFGFPGEFEAFHWHGETFDLPAGAVRLAESAGCENQAFQIGGTVIGLQFHLECTAESVRRLVEHCPADLAPSPYTQTREEILRAAPGRYRSIHSLMKEVLWCLSGRDA